MLPLKETHTVLSGRFCTVRAQRAQLLFTCCLPGNSPENHPPTEACMIHSKQHRGCRNQDPGTRGYRWWKTADFSQRAHSTRCTPSVGYYMTFLPPEPSPFMCCSIGTFGQCWCCLHVPLTRFWCMWVACKFHGTWGLLFYMTLPNPPQPLATLRNTPRHLHNNQEPSTLLTKTQLLPTTPTSSPSKANLR